MTNRMTKSSLGSHCHQNSHDWFQDLPWAKYSQHLLTYSSTSFTSFHWVLGCQYPLFPWLLRPCFGKRIKLSTKLPTNCPNFSTLNGTCNKPHFLFAHPLSPLLSLQSSLKCICMNWAYACCHIFGGTYLMAIFLLSWLPTFCEIPSQICITRR